MQVSPRSWLVFAFLSIVWGSSFILIKKGLISFSGEEVAALRISFSTLAFVPIYFLFFHKPVPRGKLVYIALVGLLGNGAPAFLYAIAQTHISSSVAGILNSLTPIFTWMLGMLFFATIYARNQMVGVFLGLLGALMIIALEPDFQLTFNEFALLILIATICYGFAGNIVKRHLQDVHPVALSAFAFFSIGAFAIGYLCTTDVAHAVSESQQARLSLLAVGTLALAGTVLANILFFRLIQETSALFASAVAYCIPVTALVWGIMDGEVLQWTHLAGMGLILLGVYVLRRA